MEIANVKKLDKLMFPLGGGYLWGALSGPANATKRQSVMALLGQKLPKSKCGYTLVENALRTALEIDADQSSSNVVSGIIEKLKSSRGV